MFSKGKTTKASSERTIAQHEQLLTYIEDGNGDAAEALWRDYWVPYTQDEGTAVVDVLRESGGQLRN